MASVSIVQDASTPNDDVTKFKKHHSPLGNKFVNPWPSFQDLDPQKVAQFVKSKAFAQQVKTTSTASIEDVGILNKRPNFNQTRSSTSEKLQASWLGHACVFVEFPNGPHVLFDPVFTDRCSPIPFFGPRRFTRPPCTIAEIPIIDVVIISHNHYDHLSRSAIREINKRHPAVEFFVPLGNAIFFRRCGIMRVTELDWWQDVDYQLPRTTADSHPKKSASPPPSSTHSAATTSSILSESHRTPSLSSARISCLPAQHNTGRSLWDADRTLWASWSVRCDGFSVYFAGDTGYQSLPSTPSSPIPPPNPAFAQIGQFRGPFTLGLLPIGAYAPREFSSGYHASPEDAVCIFKDTKCERALAMHWGTWVLGTEEKTEPPRRLREALAEAGLPKEGVFDVCAIGETMVYRAEVEKKMEEKSENVV